jgi:hypothetical protein
LKFFCETHGREHEEGKNLEFLTSQNGSLVGQIALFDTLGRVIELSDNPSNVGIFVSHIHV